MVATYIQELLATNNRVIVPNFGAFLVRATSKNKDANTLEEKLKDIYFSPFLKFNDELLEKYIIKKEGVSKEEAAKKITEFIDKVKKELDDEKPFIIQDFGHFEADKQGKVQFVTIPKEKAEPKAAKTTSTKTATSATKKTESKKEEAKAEDKPKTEPAKPEQKTEKPEAKESSAKLKEYKDDTKETDKPEEKAKTPSASAQSKPIYSYKKEKKPINKGLVWSIAIGVPVAVIFVWALLNFSTVKKVFQKDQAITEKTEKQKKSVTTKKTAATKKTTAKTPAKEQTKKQPEQKAKPETATVAEKQQPTQPQKKYYIIAGSFKNEKYATAFLNKLKAEGYNAEKLEERNGMHAVSYNSFTDKRKAIAEYKFLAQEKGLQTWILYY